MTTKNSKHKLFIGLSVLIALALTAWVFRYSQSDSGEQISFDYRGNISKYEKKLEAEPGNCFYSEQIAGSYQALNEFDNAISYYQLTFR